MDIVARLTNWGNWARSKLHYGACHSIEHRYQSPQCWHPVEPRIIVYEHDALAVERQMRFIPDKHRKALKYKYVQRMTDKQCWQRLILRPDKWGSFLLDAQHMVENRLVTLDKRELKAYKTVSVAQSISGSCR